MLAVGGGHQAGVLKVEKLERVATWDKRRQPGIARVRFAPDGKRVGIALSGDSTNDFDGRAVIWMFGSRGQPLELKGHIGGVQAIAFSPDGKLVATGGRDWSVRIWDLPPPSATPLAPAGSRPAIPEGTRTEPTGCP